MSPKFAPFSRLRRATRIGSRFSHYPLPAGPDVRVKITEEYARLVGCDAYFWTWPMVNIYNRRLAFTPLKEAMRTGPLMSAPLNHLAMLTDYIEPEERSVACPNQDVVYGISLLALDPSPVVVQVPDFGSRFWVYQVVDLRTTASSSLARCTRRRQASTCWSARSGTARCRRG